MKWAIQELEKKKKKALTHLYKIDGDKIGKRNNRHNGILLHCLQKEAMVFLKWNIYGAT